MPGHTGKDGIANRSGAAGAANELASSVDVRSAIAVEEARRRRRPWKVVFVIAMVVFVGSLVALGLIALSYHQGQQRYGEIAETAQFDPPGGDQGDGADVDVSKLTVDWAALKKANPDTVGWVYVPGTVINYPIVQGDDNDFYLYHDFDGEAGWLAEYGSIFLDHANNPKWTDALNFVYGHHMNDGSMFADVTALVDQSRFDASRIVYLLTPGGNFKLRSFSLVHCPGSEEIVVSSFKNKDEMARYVQDKIDRSEVDVGTIPPATNINRMFAFATCDDFGEGRYILYTYVLDTNLEGLTGTVGVAEEGGEASGLVEDLETD